MNRQEFLRQLAQLLEDIPEAERREALEYYNNYFDDAGPENEAQVIQELGGDPKKAAASLKAEFQSAKTSQKNYGEYSEQGFRDTRIPHNMQTPRPMSSADNDHTEKQNKGHREFFKDSKTKKIVIIILALAAACSIGMELLGGIFGLVFGLLGGIFGLVFGLLAAVFGLAAGLAGAALATITGGAAMTAAGLVKCITNPALGLLITGLGLIILAVGILLLISFLWVAIKILPRLARWCWKHLLRFFDWCQEKWKSLKK